MKPFLYLIVVLFFSLSACRPAPEDKEPEGGPAAPADTFALDSAGGLEESPQVAPFSEPLVRRQQVNPDAAPPKWEQVAPGLEYGEADAWYTCNIGDSKVTLLRIDPAYFNLKLISAKQIGGEPRTAPDWVRGLGLVAAVNAGMYQSDFLTNVGYMRTGDFVNNGRLNDDRAMAAFDPKDPGLPPFQILDAECDNWEELMPRYGSLTQSIRMISCRQESVWGQQDRYWSMVVLAADKQGRAIFAFTRSPYSVHDFIEILQRLSLNLHNAMYLEGGPEASFYLRYGDFEVGKMGSYETGFYEEDSNDRFWPVPNIIAVVGKVE